MSGLPTPPCDDAGELTYNEVDVRTDLVGGLGLDPCCVCGQASAYTLRLRRAPGAAASTGWTYHGLHARCAETLIERWRELLDSDDRPIFTPASGAEGKLTGAYARRAAARAAAATAATTTTTTTTTAGATPVPAPGRRVLREPERPAELVFTARPDVAGDYQARGALADGRPISAMGVTLDEAVRLMRVWRRNAALGCALGPRTEVPASGFVVGPDGVSSEHWSA